jgi:hypothetical protein
VAYLPVPCQHCENAPCIEAADGAITRRPDGIVLIDTVKAKGNKALVDACPYGAIWWNEEADIGQKCIFCAHLIDDPAWAPHTTRCTHSCPTVAMATYFVEPEEMAKMIAAEGLEAYLPELGTKPHTLYKNLHKFTKNFVTAGVLVDGDCFAGAAVTLHSKDGGATLATGTTNFFGEFKFDGLENGEYKLEVDADGKKHTALVTIDAESQNLGFIKL